MSCHHCWINIPCVGGRDEQCCQLCGACRFKPDLCVQLAAEMVGGGPFDGHRRMVDGIARYVCFPDPVDFCLFHRYEWTKARNDLRIFTYLGPEGWEDPWAESNGEPWEQEELG